MKKTKAYMRVLSLTLILLFVISAMCSGMLTISADAKEYKSGARIYVGDLKAGDIIGKGSVLYPSMEARMGVTTAELNVDGEQIKIRQSLAETYTTERTLRVDSIKFSVYSRNICAYVLKAFDEEGDSQKNYKNNSHIYVGDMKIGDVAGAGATLHSSGDGSEYSAFEVYLDESSKRANDSYFQWSPSTPIRLVSAEKDSYSPNKLVMRFETFYADGEVGSEASLCAALNKDEVIVMANNIELSDCFFVKDGKEHTIDLNGYTLSRNLESKVATGHVFQVNKGSKLTIKDSSTEHSGLITGGLAPNGGGAYIDGELIMDGGTIAGNTADNGGGLFVRGGSVTINKNAVIEDNASQNGGGIYITENGTVTMNGGSAENNKSSDNGGGIYNLGKLAVNGGTVSSNIAGQSGTGIWSKGKADLKKAEIARNYNAENGGGIINYGTMTLSGCTIASNSAKSSGGGIMLAEGSQTSLSDKTGIGQNYAKDGGGICVISGTVNFKDTALEGNIASGFGGAVWFDSGTSAELVNVNISSNSSTSDGSGIFTKGALSLTDCTIRSNTGGSGVYFDSGNKLTLKNTSVTGNAGGIYMNSGSMILAGGRIVVDDNMKDSAYSKITFKNYTKIKVTGELYPESRIGITPPANYENRDLTENYSEFNEANADTYFFCDTGNYRLSPEEEYPEAQLVKRLTATAKGYKVKVTVKVTDDADWWDEAYLYFYVKDNYGQDSERYLKSSPDFHKKIDSSDGYYEYELDCGTSFPSAVKFRTKYGTAGAWRDFEADVKIYINGVTCCSRHCIHNVYGVEAKETKINIPAGKYPRPFVEIDQKNEVDLQKDETKYISITAVDQYGVGWTPKGEGAVKMENLSFPENDTCTKADDSGMKWKVDTSLATDHYSEYRLTLVSGSDETEVARIIPVHFSFPLHLTVVVDDETVMTKTGHANERIQIKNYPCKEGYYINNYVASGACFLEANDDGTYTFAFGKEDIVLTATLKGIRYTIEFEKNGDPLMEGKDVTCVMVSKTMTYGKAAVALPKCYYKREGYTFTGWNTKADGTGTNYADKEKVKDLTTVPNDVVHLYAQWKLTSPTTTASIFSEGNLIIYIGCGATGLSYHGNAVFSEKEEKSRR